MTEHTIVDRNKRYTIEDDFQPIFDGKIVVPNYEEMDLAAGVANIAAFGSLHHEVGRAKFPNDTYGHGHWARFFIADTQWGGFDGTGYVMWYDMGKGRIGHFAICKHQKVEGPGANHSRGWHPGWCGLCGLDMTVDSGD